MRQGEGQITKMYPLDQDVATYTKGLLTPLGETDEVKGESTVYTLSASAHCLMCAKWIPQHLRP